jgi:hypothetical protein
MSSPPIVKGFDVIKGGTSGLRSCLKGLSLNAFALETMEEAFHGRIIITVRCPTHAYYHAFLPQEGLIAFTGVGAPTIAVMQ